MKLRLGRIEPTQAATPKKVGDKRVFAFIVAISLATRVLAADFFIHDGDHAAGRAGLFGLHSDFGAQRCQ